MCKEVLVDDVIWQKYLTIVHKDNELNHTRFDKWSK